MKNYLFANYLNFCKIEQLKPSNYTSLKKFKNLLETIDKVL